MVTVHGQHYTVGQLAQRVVRLPPRSVMRHLVALTGRPLARRAVSTWTRRYSPQNLPAVLGFSNAHELLEHHRGDAFQAWLLHPQQSAAHRDRLHALIPEFPADALRRGESALRHEVDLLGSGPVRLSTPIDWLCDFRTGRRWEPAYHADIDYANLTEPSDVKIPWELSRCHQLVDLARAQLAQPHPRWAAEASAQWLSWIDANPLGMSVNWACTMEVALRAVNWIWALSVLAPQLDDDVLLQVIASLFQHGHFVEATLERSDINGNHYISDALGLVALGALFRNHRTAERWFARGAAILEHEIMAQVHADGVDHEASIPYHRLVAEIFLVGFLVMARNQRQPRPECWQRLQRMGEFAAAYTRPDGTVPVWGDADDGRVTRFGRRYRHSHQHLLSTMACLWQRPDLGLAAGSLYEDTLWLLGACDASVFAPPASPAPVPAVASFPDGGFAILRAADIHVTFDAGPVGLRGRGGHGHNDALSIEVWLGGQPLIIDPGSYVYTADPHARNRFRSSRAHNAPVLDEREAAELGDTRHLWTIADQAQARIASNDTRQVVGEHRGYTRFAPEAVVRRTVRVIDGGCDVIDEVDPNAGTWTVTFTLAPGVHAAKVACDRVSMITSTAPVELSWNAASAVEVVATVASPSYGVLRPTTAVVVTLAQATLRTRIRLLDTD